MTEKETALHSVQTILFSLWMLLSSTEDVVGHYDGVSSTFSGTTRALCLATPSSLLFPSPRSLIEVPGLSLFGF